MTGAASPLARRIQAAMEAKGLSVTGLARAAGLPHHASLSKLFAGAYQDLGLDTLRKLAMPLGMTLAQMVGDDDAPPKDETMPTGTALLSLQQIRRSALNPRKHFDQEALEELAASIAAQGLLQNLVVRPSADDPPEMPLRLRHYELVAGERRLRALQILDGRGEWDRAAYTVPVRIVEGDDAQHLALALLENLQRQDVNAMEEAEAFTQLQALDPARWTATAIAAAIGCSARHIQQRLALVSRLAEPVQDALRTGAISATQARVLMLVDPVKQAATLKTIGRFKSADDLKNHLTNGLIPVSRAHFDLATYDGEILEMEGGARYFADTEVFLRAQQAAAEATVARLREIWAWAELSPYPIQAWDDDYDRKRVPDPTIAGALVWLDWQHQVVIETGFVRVDADAEADETAAIEAEFAAEEAQRAADREEFRDFGQSLHRLIRQTDGLAEKIMIIESLTSSPLTNSWFGRVQGVPGRHLEPGGAFAWLPANAVRDAPQQGWVILRDNDARLAAWRVLDTLSPDEVSQAARVIVAGRLDIGYTPPLILITIARAAGIPIPRAWRDQEQADIEDAIADSGMAPQDVPS